MEDNRKIDLEIIEKLNADSSIENQSLEQLRREYAEERAKKNPDYALVGELAMIIAQKEGAKPENIDVPECVAEIKRRAGIKHRIFAPKRLAAACIPLVLLLGLNAYTINAQGVNVFKALVDFVQGGVLIGFEDEPKDVVELPTSENDPYGFVAKLAEYGIEFETPHYIPDGFVLTTIDTNCNDIGQSVCFIFENNNENFSTEYTKYFNEIPKIGIPSDYHNISETEVNGSPAVVSKEDDQYTIIYQKDKKEFFMFADKVPYEECDKIVDSIR